MKASYYTFPNGAEAEDICQYLNFNRGNIVKYVARAGRKDPKKELEDLCKALDYLTHEINRVKKEKK